jgi:thioredoxin reductase
MYDVVIIGGCYAGIAAAMPLARARRDVLVLDAGQRRNRFATAAHGFLGQDGVDPGIVAERGKQEVLAYPTVTWRDEEATSARRDGDVFVVTTRSGEVRARRLVLATGVIDELPPVPGIRERWGRTVFHCPYCHGYELNRGKLGVLATSEHSPVHAALVAEWASRGDTTLFLGVADAGITPTPEQFADLDARGVQIERAPIIAAEGGPHNVIVRVEGREPVEVAGLFVATRMQVAGPFAAELGCAVDTHPMGNAYRTDPMTKETTVPGVFACGDVAAPPGALPFAVADGFRAGVGVHRSLVFPALK